jgi:NAD+ kinase
VVDGQQVAQVRPGDRIVVRKAPVTFQLVKVAGHSYYQTLRDKLRWGTTPNYNGEP